MSYVFLFYMYQNTHLTVITFKTGCVIAVGDQAHHHCVVCKLYDGGGVVRGHTVEYREYRSRLRDC